MTHTPGPWEVAPSHCSVLGNPDAAGFDDLCVVADCEPDDPCCVPADQQDANARLIAAAPDLLAALEDAKQWLEHELGRPSPDGPYGQRLSVYAAAIAKARGA